MNYVPDLWHDFAVTVGGLAGALTAVELLVLAAISGAALFVLGRRAGHGARRDQRVAVPAQGPEHDRGAPAMRPSRLIAGVPRGAVDVRVHAGVIQRAGQDRHRDGAGAAAIHRSLEIPALPGGDTPDDQPDDEKQRSDVHLDLHGNLCIGYEKAASRKSRGKPTRGNGN